MVLGIHEKSRKPGRRWLTPFCCTVRFKGIAQWQSVPGIRERCRSDSCCPTNSKHKEKMDNLEKKVADTILQRASGSIEIGGVEYPVAPPTVATIIMVSELVSTMPEVDKKTGNILYEVLGTAKDLSVIGKIAAVLILGAKRVKEQRKLAKVEGKIRKRSWSWRRFRFVYETATRIGGILEVDYIAGRILDEVSPETLLKVVSKRLGLMQIGDFFALTTSLSEANRLKRTKEVGTASGD